MAKVKKFSDYDYDINLTSCSAADVAGQMNTIVGETDSLQWAKRQIMAELGKARKWTDEQIKDGDAKKFLDDIAVSSSQTSELRSFAAPKVRKVWKGIRDEAFRLSELECFGNARSGNISGLLVTQVKKGKTVKEAGAIVKKEKESKNKIAQEKRDDPAKWLAAELEKLGAALKTKFKDADRQKELIGELAKLKPKKKKDKKESESDNGDVYAALDGMGSVSKEEQQIAALAIKAARKKNKKKKK